MSLKDTFESETLQRQGQTHIGQLVAKRLFESFGRVEHLVAEKPRHERWTECFGWNRTTGNERSPPPSRKTGPGNPLTMKVHERSDCGDSGISKVPHGRLSPTFFDLQTTGDNMDDIGAGDP